MVPRFEKTKVLGVDGLGPTQFPPLWNHAYPLGLRFHGYPATAGPPWTRSHGTKDTVDGGPRYPWAPTGTQQPHTSTYG